jgi:hypothetical protein
MIEPTIYLNSKDVPLTEALEKMTDECLDEGNYCTQTVIDLRDALKQCLKEIKSLNDQSQTTTSLEHKIMNEETVTISKKEYESLLEDRKWRIALENAGVDNWEGIDYARELLNEDE